MRPKDRQRSTQVPLADEGVAGRPGRSINFERCRLVDVAAFIKKYHYSHTHPGGIDYAFKLTWNKELAGACVFGHMAGNPKALCVLRERDDPKQYRELMRLVLLDAVPKNTESRFIAWCLRWLRDNTDLLAIISFADPKHGHTGTVYQASNWIYTGLQKPDRPRMIINRKEVHPRMVYNRYGTSGLVKLAKMGVKVRLKLREPKHRFVYVLRPELKPLLKYEAKEYV